MIEVLPLRNVPVEATLVKRQINFSCTHGTKLWIPHKPSVMQIRERRNYLLSLHCSTWRKIRTEIRVMKLNLGTEYLHRHYKAHTTAECSTVWGYRLTAVSMPKSGAASGNRRCSIDFDSIAYMAPWEFLFPSPSFSSIKPFLAHDVLVPPFCVPYFKLLTFLIWMYDLVSSIKANKDK